jgi:heptose-I-phosphate ethanolaminephosphotransferase
VIVLVLGESASRHHFGIYGYERPTTPRLSARQDLVVFADASAPANLTQYSLYVMLTPATVLEPALFHKYPSILGLANAAGFDTFWFSNQSKLNRYNNEVSVIAEEANQRGFRSTGNVSSMDEGLLPHLNRALDGGGRKKFVVLHTLGSHVHYGERYPSGFNVFTGKPVRAKVDDPGVWELINTYDNSILYTDYFLDRVIASVEATNKPGCVVYISDHGEYLSPDKPISGHGYPRPLRQEADIPLLVWCSAEHWRRHPTEADAMARNKALPVAGEDLFYALADLMDVDFNGMDTRRSFFSVDYVPPRTRWMMSSEKPEPVERLKWEVVFE